MSRIIAGVYEIERQIGAGGGGIAYLGRHLRLQKWIVLKAYQHTINRRLQDLRQEVDMLKGLNHTYIPQVYDFVQEDGVIYAVMDFIEGESLDKVLARGQIPPQRQVIRWACQLLEALCYLHSRPPHGVLHADIKPANIMLRLNGDICLIDYDIALALGEDGAATVGYSAGYASPEHYGMEYPGSGRGTLGRVTGKSRMDRVTARSRTAPMAGRAKVERVTGKPRTGWGHSVSSGESKTGEMHLVKLDVRSDIYSLGATLYHLISGRRPAGKAPDVKPLGPDVCSPQISRILQKAMASSRDMRYQSAAEMLDAFRNLHRRDGRAVWHRRCALVSAALLSVTFLAGGACSLVGMKWLRQTQEAMALAEYSANSLAEGDISEAVRLALEAIPEKKGILEAPVTAQAQKALTDALGVYDLSEGYKALDTVKLSSAPFGVAVSPEGTRFAVIYAYEAQVFDTESGDVLAIFPLEKSALSDIVFVDEARVVYAGRDGMTAYDLDMGKTLWTGETATGLSVSADGTVVAAVNRDEDHGVLYRMSDGSKMADCPFGGLHMSVAANDIFADPGNSIFALNGNGTMLAVSFEGGALTIFDLENPDGDLILYDQSDYVHFDGGFCGKYFAFVADKSGESQFGLVDIKEAAYIGGDQSPDNYFLKADESGIFLARGNLLVSLDPDTGEETELAYTDNVNITGFSIGKGHIMVATDDQGFSFYDRGAHWMSSEKAKEPCDFVSLAGKHALIANRNEPSLRMMKLEDHEENLFLSYDARYGHDEARISQDGKTVMLFSYENFRIYNMSGEILAQVEIPDAKNIYDQQYRKSDQGSWLEVIWYDGTVRRYGAEDGRMISEEKGEAPGKDLYEEFDTDQYRIMSPLHGTPEVYDKRTGRKVGELEEDSYLTYVTQVGEYVLTEYVSAAGDRYGLLLDGELETVARLPGLCDVWDGKLVFDYESGNLRQCRLYSLEELVKLGERYISKTGRDGE